MKNDSYINIQGWMVNELNLKGNDLLVYAIIYGFSQDGESRFNGGLQYLADWCGATKQGIQKNLKSLLDKGLIAKFETIKNNVKYCEYSCIPYNRVAYPIQHSCINNIDNTINKESSIISKDIITTTKSNENEINSFLGSATKKPKKESLYSKCIGIINSDYAYNSELCNSLLDYLKMLLEKYKDKEKPLYANMFKGKLNKLDSLAKTDKEKIDIVRYAIERGWENFYPINNGGNGSGYIDNMKVIDNSPMILSDEEF